MVNLVRGFQKLPYRQLVVCLEEGGPFVAEVEKLGATVIVLGKQPGLSWRTIRQLAKLFRQEKVAIVHTHNPSPHFHGVLAAAVAGVPVRIHTKHGRNYPGIWKRVLLNRALAWFTDMIVPVSDNAGAVALQIEKVNPRKVRRIWNGVDTRQYAPRETIDHRPQTADHCQLSTVNRPLVIGTVARLSTEKDQLTMLAAFKLVLEQWDETAVSGLPRSERGQQVERNPETSNLKPEFESGTQVSSLRPHPSPPISHLPSPISQSPRCASVSDRALNPTEGLQTSDSGLQTQVSEPLASSPSALQSPISDLPTPISQSPVSAKLPRLAIIGDGPCLAELQTTAQRLGIASHVDFFGARSDIPTQLSTFDIFTLSSITEGISMTILEAMACGVPIVASDVGGNREIVQPPLCGLIVPARDPQALANAYLELLWNPARQVQMGVAGRQRVITNFSLDKMVADYADLYAELLCKNGLAANC